MFEGGCREVKRGEKLSIFLWEWSEGIPWAKNWKIWVFGVRRGCKHLKGTILGEKGRRGSKFFLLMAKHAC